MNVDSGFLMSQGEWFAAGFFEVPGGSPVVRMGQALRRQLENCVLPVCHAQLGCHAQVCAGMSSPPDIPADSGMPARPYGRGQTWAWHPLYPSGPNTIYATRHNVFTFNYSYSA